MGAPELRLAPGEPEPPEGLPINRRTAVALAPALRFLAAWLATAWGWEKWPAVLRSVALRLEHEHSRAWCDRCGSTRKASAAGRD